MTTHITVENAPPEIEALTAAITNRFHQIGSDEMQRVLLFDLDFDLIEVKRTYRDSEGTIIIITTNGEDEDS